jgi:general secretion pathway protein E
MPERQRIGHYLLQHVSEEELDQALKAQKRVKQRLGEILVNLGFLSEENLCSALSEQLGLPMMGDKDFPEAPLPLDGSISFKFMKNYHVLVLDRELTRARLVMADPTDVSTLDNVRLALGVDEVDLSIATRALVSKWLDTYYGEASPQSLEALVKEAEEGELEILRSDNEDDIGHLQEMASEAPIIRLVNLFISESIQKRASDIHIEPFEQKMRVRYRVDGILHDAESPPRRLHAAVISRVKIMAELNIAERRLPQSGRIKMRVGGRKIDLRVETSPTQWGESVVMRVLDRSSIMLSVEDLGFPEDHRRTFDKLIHLPHGIILVTGPTGSGKTTTLYAALNRINTPDKKIITVEDPVEYQLQGVNQIQVNSKISLTFSNGLRSIVRQDPDVILIGEIRDKETADIAIQSALTGHLVFSTLHTNDAPGSVTRLLDMGVEQFLISSVIEGVLAQRLVRIVCRHCAVARPAAAAIVEELRAVRPDLPSGFLPVQGAGCEHCGGTGYRGRKGIFELLLVNDELRALINQRASAGELRRAARRHGMRSLREDGWRKVIRHETTVEEVLRVTQEDEMGFGD